MATVSQNPKATAVPAPAPRRASGLEELLRETAEMARFFGRTVRALPGSLTYFSEALRQGSMMITGTVVLVFVMSMFLGAAVANAGYFVLRAIGAGDYFGLMSGFGISRFTGHLIFSYVFAAKICCGIAAQIGAMKIQQEVDALESTGVDPMSYLIGTRLIGVALFLPVAFVATYVGGTLGSYIVTVVLAGGLSDTTFFAVHWSVQRFADLMFMGAVMTVTALFCAVVASFYGLRTTGGPAAVGNSVARSLVVNLIAIHLIATTGSVLMYGIDARLPIGG